MDLTAGDTLSGQGPATIELELHRNLKITRAKAAGAKVIRVKRDSARDSNDADKARHLYHVTLDQPVDALTLFVEYEGILHQDPSSGEKSGQIHNFEMEAHIGEEGIYLSEGTWYPVPVPDPTQPPPLVEFTLIAESIPNVALKASAESDPVLAEQFGRQAWSSPYPLPGLALVGGPHTVHRSTHAGKNIALHLKESQSKHAAGLLRAVIRNFERYEPLVGPCPSNEFAIVDNFFSSGFAFPTFTLLSSAVIDMGERSQTTHGYIDHEMLHCWWGNGVLVDPRDGNWSEALASYCTNYYGHILDGNPDEARRKRRNYSHFLSPMKPEQDRPLGSYGLLNGCSRSIAYDKGAMVFHMIARRIGQEKFWRAMRRFSGNYLGRYATWEDIRLVCEEEGHTSLSRFFQQWVRSGGAPSLSVEDVRYDSSRQTLSFTLSQGEPAFDLDVPVRINHADGASDLRFPLSRPSMQVSLPVDHVPLTVEIDPDYHVFRKVPLSKITPTTARTTYGQAFASVIATGSVHEDYLSVRTFFENRFEQDERVAFTTRDIEDGALAERCVLVLGDAVRNPYVAGFLSAVEFPVRWHKKGFSFDQIMYTQPEHAVLCTIHHPGVEGGGITVLCANSEAAIPKPINVMMYDRSVVIFRDRKPVLRHDLEPGQAVPVGY